MDTHPYELKPKVDIFVDQDVREQLVMFLVTDWMSTGLGYSAFISKSIELWRSQFSEDTDRCTWQYDLVSRSWVSGCEHRQLKRPTGQFCPYCVKPILIGALSAHQWSKEYDAEIEMTNERE